MALLIFAVFMTASMVAGVVIGIEIERKNKLHGANTFQEDDCEVYK